MASPSTLQGDYYINGAVTAKSINYPAQGITDAAIAAGSGGNYIGATKVQHQIHAVDAQANGSANVARRVVVEIIQGATATIAAVSARNTTAAAGSDKTTVDVYKNGASILTTPINLNLAAATTVQSGSLAVTSAVAGDVIEVVYALTGTSVGNGGCCQVTINQDPQ